MNVIYIPSIYFPWTLPGHGEKVISMKQSIESVIKCLGKVVRSLREQRGLSQESFADNVGMDRTYISGIERGILNPSIKNITRIAIELDVPVSVLLGCSGRCHFGKERT